MSITSCSVTDKWVMKNLVTPLENMDIGDVFVFNRNTIARISTTNTIMDGINSSNKFLYVAGNEQNIWEQERFFFALQLAIVEKLQDTVSIYKNVAADDC